MFVFLFIWKPTKEGEEQVAPGAQGQHKGWHKEPPAPGAPRGRGMKSKVELRERGCREDEQPTAWAQRR